VRQVVNLGLILNGQTKAEADKVLRIMESLIIVRRIYWRWEKCLRMEASHEPT
jgi:hypothetical protein